MADSLLLDTGPLVALLDASERRHADCAAFFKGWTGRVVTTEAVVTEATHLLSGAGAPSACLEFVLRGGARVMPWHEARLERVLELLRKYADVPMDYADATLVALAEENAVGLVFTLDRRGFETYRWDGRRKFRLVP